jgi:periplasmic protein TonB
MHHTTSLIAARMHRRPAATRGGVDLTLLRRVVIGIVAIGLIALLVMGVRKLMSEASAPRHQVARIALLPDTPPPPPPPPKERKEEPPKSEKQARPTPEQVIKPPQAQAPAPLKMEGAAGNGPSAFAAGSVSQDYKGGTPTIGGQGASGVAGGVSDRAQERLYANSVRQMLRDELERHLSPDAGELTTAFALWITGDGRVTRWEFDPREPVLDPARQAALKLALERSAETLTLPSPQALAQPMRFRLTVRAGG